MVTGKPRHCLVLGGGGFIGSWVADRLLADGYVVRIFDKPRVAPYRSFGRHEQMTWLSGDFLSSADISEALDQVDTVIHLVSTTLPKSSNDDPIYDVQTNLVATLQLLNAMVTRKVGRIVFVSSGGTVYGRAQKLPIDEHHPTRPVVSYGITKLAIEHFLALYERIHGIQFRVLRVSNPYGIRQRIETAQGVATAFLQRAFRKEPIEIWGDGSVVRDFVYISDVADAFARAVAYEGDARVFNIGAGRGTSLSELIATIEDVLGYKVQYRHLPAREIDVPANVLDVALANKALGWAPRVGLQEGLRMTADWLRSSGRL